MTDGHTISLAAIRALSGPAVQSVCLERARQIDVEGFTRDHDMARRPADLGIAALDFVQDAVVELSATCPDHAAARVALVRGLAIGLAALDRIDAAEGR